MLDRPFTSKTDRVARVRLPDGSWSLGKKSKSFEEAIDYARYRASQTGVRQFVRVNRLKSGGFHVLSY